VEFDLLVVKKSAAGMPRRPLINPRAILETNARDKEERSSLISSFDLDVPSLPPPFNPDSSGIIPSPPFHTLARGKGSEGIGRSLS